MSGSLVWGLVVGLAACSSSNSSGDGSGIKVTYFCAENDPTAQTDCNTCTAANCAAESAAEVGPDWRSGINHRSVRGRRVVPRAVRVRRLFVLRRVRPDVRDRRLSGRRRGHRQVHGQELPVVLVDDNEQCGRRRERLSHRVARDPIDRPALPVPSCGRWSSRLPC